MIARRPWPPTAPAFKSGRLLRGPNVHHHASVYVQDIAPGSLVSMTTAELDEAFVERTLHRFAQLESLEAGGCLRPGFVEKLDHDGGMSLVEFLLELTLAVERSTASAMRRLHAPAFGTVGEVPGSAQPVARLVWESWSGGISRVAARAALASILEFLPRGIAPEPQDDFARLMAWLIKRARRRQWAPNTAVIAYAAGRRGVPHEALAGNYLRLGDGHLQQVVPVSSLGAPGAGEPTGSGGMDDPGRRRLHQVLVIGGEVVSGIRIDPPRIVGDGSHTLGELVGRFNAEPLRGGAGLRPVMIDASLKSGLAGSGWHLEDKPAAGQEVVLESIRELEDGAVPVVVTGSIHPFNRELAVAAAAERGLGFAAVDIMVSDLARSGNRGRARVVRVHPAPDLLFHALPDSGQCELVGGRVLDRLFPAGHPSRVPIALVVGERGTIRIARELDRFLRVSRLGVALSTKTHTTILGKPVERLSSSGTTGPEHLLSDPRVEVLVDAVSPRKIVERGLRIDQFTVAAVLDPVPGRGRRVRDEGIRVALESTTGPVCIGAGNPDAASLLESLDATRVVLVASRRAHPLAAAHLATGGAVVQPASDRDGPAVEWRRKGSETLRIPVSLFGMESMPEDGRALERLLWAAAMALGLGVTGPPAPVEDEEPEAADPVRKPTGSPGTPGAS